MRKPASPPTRPADGEQERIEEVQRFIVDVLHETLRAPSAQVDQRISLALGRIGTFLDCDRTYVFRVREGKYLCNTHEWCAPEIRPMQGELQRLPLDIIDYWLPSFLRRDAVPIGSVQTLDDDRREKKVLLMQGIRSLLVVPMLDGEKLVGFVGFDRVRIEKKFSQGEVYLLQSAADVIMSVLLRHDTELLAEAANKALRREQAFLQSILHTATSAIVAFNEDLEIVFLNQEARQMLEALRSPDPALKDDTVGAKHYLGLFAEQVLFTGHAIRNIHHVVNFSDGTRHVLSVNAAPVSASGAFTRAKIVCSIADLTREVSIESALNTALTDAHQLTFFDPLTGLPNRRLVTEQITNAAASGGTAFRALLCFDIDRMRGINEFYGVQKGDKFLLEVATRLKANVPAAENVGRISGNEFTILLSADHATEWAARKAAERLAEEILEVLRTPVQLGASIIHGSASAGVVVFPTADGNESVMNKASIAARAAKAEGGGRVSCFDANLHQQMIVRAQLDADLPGALGRNEFCLHYEPQIHWGADGFRVIGYEALIRWMHPQRGLQLPAAFIPHAEESGLVSAIDDWVIREACHQLNLWAETAPSSDLTISLNVSPRRFMQGDFVDYVAATVKSSGVKPGQIRFELTESSLLKDATAARNVMEQLSRLGISLALDDFGTGFSSLKYLHDLPVDVLKIDRSFVRNLWETERNAAIIKSIISLGESLSLLVIAEGVESREQLDWLCQNGCTRFQGYHFDRPKPASAIIRGLINPAILS